MTDLAALRALIARVDEQILRLTAERFKLVEEVGATKRALGTPVRSYGAESEVLKRFDALAAELGIDARVAEQLAHLLIGEAVRRQEQAATVRTGQGRRVLIVGGGGKMGRWLATFFAGQGHEVTTLDPQGPVESFRAATDLHEAVREADVVLVAAPLAAGKDVLVEILNLEPTALVADIFSLKSHVLEPLSQAARRGLKVASLHPLFGPGVRTLSGRVVAVCDCGNAAAADEAAALFEDTALTITRLPLAQHDEVMQFVLGLSHLVAILFFTTLSRSGRTFAGLAPMASTTFLKEARTAAEVARENPYLYFEIQHLNRHSPELFALLRESLGEIASAALNPDPAAFVSLMEQGRAFFPGTLPAELG